MKILLIEDEEELSEALVQGLRKCGYAVDAAFDGEEALAFYDVNGYDVIVLDLSIPKMDGLDVLRRIRCKDKTTKIIILSARSAIDDRVKGLDMGANDYLSKPFNFKELEARIRTLSRIAYIQQEVELSCGKLKLNTATKVASFGGVKLSITKKECSVLEYLLLHKGQVVESDKLLNHVWDSESDIYPDTVKYHIHSLKKKLIEANCGCDPQVIKNIRGVGYIIKEQENEANK